MSTKPLATRKNLAKIPEAAEHYGVHPITMRRWIKSGHITGYRVGPRLLMVDLDEIEAGGPVAS